MIEKVGKDLVKVGVSQEALESGRLLATAVGAMTILPFARQAYQYKDLLIGSNNQENKDLTMKGAFAGWHQKVV